MSRLICDLFGHKAPDYFRSDLLVLDHPSRDNKGKVSLYVMGICARCGQQYAIGMLPLSEAERFKHLKDFED